MVWPTLGSRTAKEQEQNRPHPPSPVLSPLSPYADKCSYLPRITAAARVRNADESRGIRRRGEVSGRFSAGACRSHRGRQAEAKARRRTAVLLPDRYTDIARRPRDVSYTQGDSGVISFHIYASWFSPPFCG